jgi:hypothetical protein
MTLNIVSQNYDLIEKLQDFLINAFRRYDDSAVSINNYFRETTANRFYFFNRKS